MLGDSHSTRPGQDALTDEAFWDSFWSKVKIPDTVGASSFDRSLMKVLNRHLPQGFDFSLVEIGCAPGRWMVYCSKTFGVSVTGYEFSLGGIAKTAENLRFHRVEAELVQADFMTCELPIESFDVVLSLGFVEHFDDPGPVMERHVRLLKPGGILVLEVPNLLGIYRVLSRWSHSDLPDFHNLTTMKPKIFRNLAVEKGLVEVETGYLGGFTPDHLDIKHAGLTSRLVTSAMSRVRARMPVLDHLNGRWISGYLYGVFRKPAGNVV